jgi:hypothetical protein
VELDCDVLVVGAGCGGIAAALTAARMGCSVVLTEPTRWVGGQLTSQAVPADEHPWIESTGATATYRQMREAVRQRYRDTRPLTHEARRDPRLNPGHAWVSAIAAEPVVIHDVLRDLVRAEEAQGRLRLLLSTVPVSAEVDGDRVEAVSFTGLGGDVSVTAAYVLDATEEGDLLPLTGCEHVVGAESSADTGEPHALDGPADPLDQQAVTWCFALERVPGRADVVDRPATYGFWRDYQAPHWPGPQLGWATTEPETGRPLRRPLFGRTGEQDLWTFRRIRHGASWVPAVPDVTLVNWPQVDYWLAPVTGVDPEQRARARTGARELSLAFVHWLQTEALRPDGGTGYADLSLRGDVLGTDDGFAMEPYVRRGPAHPGGDHGAGAARRCRGPTRCGWGAALRRLGRRRQLPDRPAPQHVRARVPRHRDLPLRDPAWGARAAATGEPAGSGQEHRDHAHHQRLLPAAPSRVGCR